MSRVCIYCQQRKPATDFSLEHIWPRALGGAQLGQLWKTKHVCQPCNTRAGQVIDGPFVRHPVIRNAKAYASWANWQQQVKRQTQSATATVELFFLGQTTEPQTIDIWAGPSGGRVWRNSKERLLFADTIGMSDAEALVFARSIYKHFKRSSFHTNDPRLLALSPIWKGEDSTPAQLLNLPRQLQSEHLPPALLDALFNKVRLGVGFQLMGDSWLKEQTNEPLSVNLKPNMSNKEHYGQSWISIVTKEQQLLLAGNLYGLMPFSLSICNNTTRYSISPHFSPLIGQSHLLES